MTMVIELLMMRILYWNAFLCFLRPRACSYLLHDIPCTNLCSNCRRSENYSNIEKQFTEEVRECQEIRN